MAVTDWNSCQVVSKLLNTAIWSGCALWLECEQTHWSYEGCLARSAHLHSIQFRIGGCCADDLLSLKDQNDQKFGSYELCFDLKQVLVKSNFTLLTCFDSGTESVGSAFWKNEHAECIATGANSDSISETPWFYLFIWILFKIWSFEDAKTEQASWFFLVLRGTDNIMNQHQLHPGPWVLLLSESNAMK